MGIKDIYFKLEDAYYRVLDKVNAKIPVYKIIDPIDKVVPSFALLILVAAALVGFFVVLPLANISPGEQYTNLEVEITTEDNIPLSGVVVTIVQDSNTQTRQSGSVGKISVTVVSGRAVRLSAEKNGYGKYSRTITPSGVSFSHAIKLALSQIAIREKTITFVGADGKKLGGVKITVEFSCSTPGAEPEPKTIETTSGEIKITPPENCGLLVISRLSAPNYRQDEEDSLRIDESSKIIKLEAVPQPTGELRMKVVSDAAELLSNIRVVLYSMDGVEQARTFSDYGYATLKAAPGGYYVVATDESAKYASARKNVSITTERRDEEIVLNRDVRGRFSIEVLDEASNARIANAKVLLKTKADLQIIAEGDTRDGNIVEFAVYDDVEYLLTVTQEEYKYETMDITIADGNITVKLEKCTPETCGIVIVSAYDEDSLAVVNAEISLYDADTNFLALDAKQITDVNGNAKFLNVPEGKYFAKALKYPASGVSESKEINIREISYFEIFMLIGQADVEITAKDQDGAAVPFAEAEFRTESGEQLGKISLDAQGTGNYRFKADKKIYAIVREGGFATYTTGAVQLMPDEIARFNAVMMPELVSGDVKAIYRGLYNANDQNVFDLVERDKTYIVKLLLAIPEEKNYINAGMHLRSGTDELMEKDDIFIKSVNAPNAGIIKGTTYAPPTGYDADAQSITEGYAKWINILLTSPEAGYYEISAEIRIRDSAENAEPLVLNYRAFGINSDNSYARDPADPELGSAESTSAKQALYAQAYEKTYYTEPPPELCSADFCFYDSIMDLKEMLLQHEEPFELVVFNDYNFFFTLQNNSDAVHNIAELRVKSTINGLDVSEDLEFSRYEFTNASGTKISGDANKANELPAIDLGNFTKNTAISGTIFLQPKIPDDAQILLEAISDYEKVWVKEVDLDTRATAKADLDVNVSPENLAPLIENPLTVVVRDSSTQSRMKDALVMVTINNDGSLQTLAPQYTDIEGTAYFTLSALPANALIIIDVEKYGYNPAQATKKISSEIIEISPETLSYNLDVRVDQQQEKEFTITSQVEPELKISKLELSLEDSDALLDIEAMQNWLDQYVGATALAKDVEETITVNAVLSEIGKTIEEGSTIEGTLNLEVKSEDFNITWPFTINVSIAVGLGPEIDLESCMDVDKTDWEAALIEGTAITDITLRNYCVIDDEPVALRDLQAEIVWNGDRSGEFQIAVEGGALEVLTPLRTSMLMEEVPADGIVNMELAFAPLPDMQGEIAEADIIITARILTGTGEEQIIQTYPDEEIRAKIFITNLKDCISAAEGSGMIEMSAESSTTFEISRKSGDEGCGAIDMQFRLCSDSDSGGCDEIEVDPRTFTLDEDGDSKTITVQSDDIAGMHGIRVEAKPSGSDWTELGWIRVQVNEPGDAQFLLDTYQVILLEKDVPEYIEVTNKDYIAKINVRAKAKNWGAYADEDYSWGASFGRALGYGLIAGGAVFAYGVVAAIAAGTLTETVTTTTSTTISTLGATTGETTVVSGGGAIGGAVVAAVVVAVVVIIAMLIFNYLESNKYETHPMYDYITNLAATETDGSSIIPYGDPDNIFTSRSGIDVRWDGNTSKINAEPTLENSTEEMAISISRTQDFNSAVVFAKIKLQVYRNCYNDPQNDGGPSPYEINAGCGRNEYSEEFMIEIDTTEESDLLFFAEEKGGIGTAGSDAVLFAENEEKKKNDAALFVVDDEPQTVFGEFLNVGKTGEGALPKVKLSWNWNDFDWNSCDADNAEAVYCDATQFGIALSKRINRLDEWLKKNNYRFECPENPLARFTGNSTNTNDVASGTIGISSVNYTFNYDTNTAKFLIAVKNSSDSNSNVSVSALLGAPSGISLPSSVANPCNKTVFVLKGGTQSITCEFAGLKQSTDAYRTTTRITSASAGTSDDIAHESSFVAYKVPDTCWLPKMDEQIEKFINKDLTFWGQYVNEEIVDWTDEIKNFDDLHKIFNFEALLIKDNYDYDFRQDFHQLYDREAFFNAPSWYLNNDVGYWRLWNEGAILVAKKYSKGMTISMPGKYAVHMNSWFTGSGWNIFEGTNISAVFMTELSYRSAPEDDNPFYYIPFDGLLGNTEQGNDRHEYGTEYSGYELKIDEHLGQSTYTYNDYNSSALVIADVKKNEELSYINKSITSRSTMLEIDVSGKKEKIIFSPAYATPVLMKVSREEGIGNVVSDFSEYYSLNMNEQGIDAGESLNAWNGAGACYDFSGRLAGEAFYYYRDRRDDEQGTRYAIDWGAAEKTGDVYLKTIFYTPRGYDTVLRAESANMRLITQNNQSPSQAVALNGINGMGYNSAGDSDMDRIDSIQDVFDLVKEEKVAVANHGKRISFFWIPSALYAQKVNGKGIADIENGLECIGS